MRSSITSLAQAIESKFVPIELGLSCPPLNHQIAKVGAFNLYQVSDGKQLSFGYGRNYYDLLMCHPIFDPALDLDIT